MVKYFIGNLLDFYGYVCYINLNLLFNIIIY